MTLCFKEIFGNTLLTEAVDQNEKQLPSPNMLKRKVIIKVSDFLASSRFLFLDVPSEFWHFWCCFKVGEF